MTERQIRWHAFDREEIPGALFGLAKPEGLGRLEPDRSLLSSGPLAIGFRSQDYEGDGPLPPTLVLLSDGRESDVFSWLSVYAEEAFPISQFARVLSQSDWELLNGAQKGLQVERFRDDRWACILLGEVLAQGDGDADISALPLSRAAGCFTAAMARAVRIHGTDEASRLCADRLRVLEADRRFVRRPVTVDALSPLWALAQAHARLDEETDLRDVVALVVSAATQLGVRGPVLGKSEPIGLLDEFPDLHSDSVEDRVVAFQRVSTHLAQMVTATQQRPLVGLLLAAAAFLVGRSTSHAFLLQQSARAAPVAFAWFGLFAAMTGPRSWDPSWSRMAKGMEKMLRTGFDWGDPTATDLCWAEYQWMSRTFEGTEALFKLPKLYPRLLSVEVVPGAPCQLRLAGSGTANGPQEHEAREDKEAERFAVEARAALEQLVSLAMKVRPLVERAGREAQSSRQAGLPLTDGGSETKRDARGRKLR
jgi:hypothetical protein